MSLRTYIRTDRDGRAAPGMVAIVQATSEKEAQIRLHNELKKLGLAKDPREGPYQLMQVPDEPGALVLRW